MTTFRFEEPDPDDRDTGPDYFLRNPARERAEEERRRQASGTPYGDSGNLFSHEDAADSAASSGRAKGGCMRRFIWLLLIVFGIACGAGYVRYFVPHTSDSAMRGRVTTLERRGIFFKVYEAGIKADDDGKSIRVSVPSDSLAAIMAEAMERDTDVCIVTEKYFTPVPWRGETSTVVTAVRP